MHHVSKGLFTGCAAACSLFAAAAHADLRVTFDEGAPKDAFRIENAGTCNITAASILIDLSTSRGGLIFDVTASGEGVEVFQPFELVAGADALATVPTVVDEQTQLGLDIQTLAPGQAMAFTIDVDDTLGQRAITVQGSEIEGARVVLSTDQASSSAVFSDRAEAGVALNAC